MNIQKQILDLLKTTPMGRLSIIKHLPGEIPQVVASNISTLLISNKILYDGHDFSIAPKRNKYGNVWTEVEGKKFQSKKEANRYSELLMLEKAGEISDLKCQVPYVVSDAVEWIGESKKLPAIKYILDFEYKVKDVDRNKRTVCEDVKGAKLRIYILKRSLFLNRYPNIQFKEI